MQIWSAEIKELETLYTSIKGRFPELEKELEQLIETKDANVVMLYSRRCLEVIITDLCECELKRPRKTEPLKGIIDKLNREEKVPSNIIASMHSLNSLSTFGAHPKEFDPEQVKPVLNNLTTIIKWYLKYKEPGLGTPEEKKEDRIKAGDMPRFENSIAVLPFQDMSPQKDQEYFCDGMTEEIINALAHVESLKVIARTSSFIFKDKYEDIREIGKKLDVETIVEGSIRKDENRLRITAQLVKVADGSHIWSERYDRELKDVFAIQDEISLAIVDNLKVKLLGEEKATIVKRHTENLEAYNLFLKGNYCWQMLTAEGFKQAFGYYERSLQKDPHYALAYIGLASVYVTSSYWGNVAPNEAYPKATEYVTKALGIDNTLAEAHSYLGFINFNYYWNWKKAELHFKQALQMNPNESLIHIYYSFLLTCTGRHEEAISEAKRAQELDPLSSYINTLVGVAFKWASQCDRTIEECRMVTSINPNYYYASYLIGTAYWDKSMIKEAITELEKAVDLSDGVLHVVSCLTACYYLIGKKDQADKLFYSLKKKLKTEYVPAMCFYLIHKVRGEEDLAFEWLERACNEHDSFLPWYRINPNDICRIPDEPRYKALLKKFGLE